MQSNTGGKNDLLNYSSEEKTTIEEMMLNRSIVEVIKQLMEHEGGMRKADLAKKLGVTNAYITKVFTSDKFVNIPFLNKVQNVFNTTFTFNTVSLQEELMKSIINSLPDNFWNVEKEAKVLKLNPVTQQTVTSKDFINQYDTLDIA